MNYKNIAQLILVNIGGSENIAEAAHCFTRLRFALKDPGKVNISAINKLDCVLQVFLSGEHLQIVFAGKMDEIYKDFIDLLKENGDCKDAGNVRISHGDDSFLKSISRLFS